MVEIHTINGFRKSRVGYSPTIPPLLKNASDIKMLSQNMKKNEIMELFLAITAKWCGACESIKPRLEKAIRSSSFPATNADETQMDSVNAQLNTSIQPPHYPYFIVLDKNGRIVKILKSIEEVEAFLASTPSSNGMDVFMKNSASKNKSNKSEPPIPSVFPPMSNSRRSNQTGNPKSISASTNNSRTGSNSENETMAALSKASIIPDETGLPQGVQLNGTEKLNAYQLSGLPDTVGKGPSMTTPASNGFGTVPPNPASDLMAPGSNPGSMSTSTTNPGPASNSKQGGGCLYSALASTAYQLAPPAVLLGIASATLGRKQRRKTRRR
jgi:hypothetical protein